MVSNLKEKIYLVNFERILPKILNRFTSFCYCALQKKY